MKHLFVSVVCLVALVLGRAGYGQNILQRPGTPAPTAAGSASVQGPSATPAHVRRQVKRPAPDSSPAGQQIRRGPGTAELRQGGTIKRQRPVISFSEASQRRVRQRHDRTWWKSHYTVIVFVNGGGYYYWDSGYWCPAWGYDPVYTYDYDGPIFTYGDLLPDQVIINVQRALQQLGYYAGGLTGSLGASTRAALAAYQEDVGLTVTGGIDAGTVEALGLY